MRFESIVLATGSVFAALGIILISMGVYLLPESIYAAATYMTIGIAQVIISGIELGFSRRKGGRELGNFVVMGFWWVLSIGIAGIALFTSPLFRVALAFVITSTSISVVWVAASCFVIWQAVSRRGARLVA